MTNLGESYMLRAIEIARNGPTSSNPRVGAVIVHGQHIVGEGFHRGAGTPHAEVEALAQAGELARGAHMFVTLEPCAHQGRTGPCTDAIIAARLDAVTFAQADPTREAGGGANILRAANIEVKSGLLAPDAARLNSAWMHWTLTGTPFVTWKFAQSIDGRVAEKRGVKTLLSGPQAQLTTHILRSEVDAIVVGTETVRIDDPQLTARDANGHLLGRQPLRVVIGESDIPRGAALRNSAGGEVIHFRTRDIAQVLNDLTDREVKHILLEGGPTVATAFLRARAVHQVITMITPKTFGTGPQVINSLLDPPYSLSLIHWERHGSDLVISGTPVFR